MVKSAFKLSRRSVLAGMATTGATLPFSRRSKAQARLDPVKIVTAAGNLTSAFEQLMVDQGFREKFGLTSKPVYVSDGSKIMGSLLSGEMDICPLAGFGQLFPAIEKGARMKLTNGSVVLGEQTVFSAKPEIRSIADLKGKTIGVGSVGAQLHEVMVALLTKKGVDINTVTFVNIGSSADVFGAIAAKTVDAGPAQIDFIPQIDKFGVHIVEGGDMWSNLPEYPFQGGFATEKVIAGKRDLLVRTLAAYGTMFRFLQGPDSHDAWMAARRKALNGSGPVFEQGSDFQWHFMQKAKPLAEDSQIPPEKIDVIQTLNVRFHVQSEKLPYDRATDFSLAREALKLV